MCTKTYNKSVGQTFLSALFIRENTGQTRMFVPSSQNWQTGMSAPRSQKTYETKPKTD